MAKINFNFTKMDDLAGLPERIKQYFPDYMQHRLQEYQQLKSALEQADFKGIREYCHKQIGVAACYHCYQLEEITRAIQAHARAGNLEPIADLVGVLEVYLHQLKLSSEQL